MHLLYTLLGSIPGFYMYTFLKAIFSPLSHSKLFFPLSRHVNIYSSLSCYTFNFAPFAYIFFGVCSTDLRLDTSTNGLKQVYTSLEAIYWKTYFLKNVHL